MNEVIAEIKIENIYTPVINTSKSTETRNYYNHHFNDDEVNLRFDQGFVWYQDFVSFCMLTDYRGYWIKIAVKDNLELDPVIVNPRKFEAVGTASVMILPFQVKSKERIEVFGDHEGSVILSFILRPGHYQLLFQNRYFTREEIEAEPNFDCENLECDDWKEPLEFCLLTFIPTIEPIEPKIFTYKSPLGTKEFSQPLILYDKKLYQNNED
ncbi:MAG: hypothetical protein ACFBSE_17770 [Prochloraceae cyanobacterium]